MSLIFSLIFADTGNVAHVVLTSARVCKLPICLSLRCLETSVHGRGEHPAQPAAAASSCPLEEQLHISFKFMVLKNRCIWTGRASCPACYSSSSCPLPEQLPPGAGQNDFREICQGDKSTFLMVPVPGKKP